MADDHSYQNVENLRIQVIRAAEQGDTEAVLAVLQNCESHIQDKILTRDVYEGSVLETAVEHHQIEIVRLLVLEFHVDINVTTVYLCASSDSALFYAIREDNEELVKELVELGANVNIVSCALTPLIAACCRQNVSMVNLLIKLGADVNLQACRGISPLMTLSIAEDPPAQLILDSLLANGADCNLQAKDGDTALHIAAACRKNFVVRKLLRKQARILPNNCGFTPPFLAAEWSIGEGTLEVFLGSNALSREEKINAFEFRAASLAPNDMNGAYDLLRQTLKARYEDPSNILRKRVCEPVAAFGYVVESQTLEELETRNDDHFALLMECLAVQHRLLGGGTGKMCRTKNFDLIWEQLFLAGRCEQAMALAEHGIGATPSETAVKIFSILLLRHNMNFQSPGTSMSSVVERGLKCCINILRGCPEDNVTYLKLCLKLLNLCNELDLSLEKQTARIQAKYFLDSFPFSVPYFYSALHATTFLMIRYNDEFDLSFYKSLVDLLVKCEAEIDAKDATNNTVLAYVLHDMTPGDNRRKTVEFLLEQGANPAYVRNNDEHPNEYIKDADVMELLRQHYPLPLSHLAAFAIVDNGIQYKDRVPGVVAKFIRDHEKLIMSTQSRVSLSEAGLEFHHVGPDPTFLNVH